ncbi:hypothetical protein VA596_11955 [Amycolatopsis sp., V23-08]|uniref:Uncharacterized protein n=1 Tax=Amycolatopsis heterodermiae TaxID=3110235 RepID=A0ABU5R219_9PSEU|nr:hypothetical protein [Amycolatopsis sp., V23-08]MEA5360251.1 hypothetical protein [Amycolatopsis sp., V23-08]
MDDLLGEDPLVVLALLVADLAAGVARFGQDASTASLSQATPVRWRAGSDVVSGVVAVSAGSTARLEWSVGAGSSWRAQLCSTGAEGVGDAVALGQYGVERGLERRELSGLEDVEITQK